MDPTQQADARPPGNGRGRRVAAFLISLLAPGAGHFLVGRFRRGFAWALALSALTVVMVLAARGDWLGPGLVLALALGLLGRVAAGLEALRLAAARPAWKWVVLAWAALLATEFVVFEPVRSWLKARYTQAFRLPSGSMRPTLLAGDFVLVDNAVYRSRSPRRGEIVVFAYPPDERQKILKRIVAMPGEQVQVREGRLRVDGRPLPESYVARPGRADPPPGDCDQPFACEPIAVPPESYFVLGDHRESSMDSRHWGFISSEKISGRAILIYWSWDDARFRPRLDRIGRRL